MYGTVTSAFSPLLYSGLISMVSPSDFEWSTLADKNLVVSPENEFHEQVHEEPPEKEILKSKQRRWTRYACLCAIATFLGHWVFWPLPMYAARFIFSRGVSSRLKISYQNPY